MRLDWMDKEKCEKEYLGTVPYQILDIIIRKGHLLPPQAALT